MLSKTQKHFSHSKLRPAKTTLKNFTSPYFINKLATKSKQELAKLNPQLNSLIDRLSRKGNHSDFSKLYPFITAYLERIVAQNKTQPKQFFLIVNNYSTMLLRESISEKKLNNLASLLFKVRDLAKRQKSAQYVGMLSNLLSEICMRVRNFSGALKAIEWSIRYYRRNIDFGVTKKSENTRQLTKIFLSNLMYEVDCLRALGRSGKVAPLVREAERFCDKHIADKSWFEAWVKRLGPDINLPKKRLKKSRSRFSKTGSELKMFSIKSRKPKKRLNKSEGVNSRVKGREKGNGKRGGSNKLEEKINPSAITNYISYKRSQELNMTYNRHWKLELSSFRYVKDMKIYDYLKNKYGKEDSEFSKNLFSIKKRKKQIKHQTSNQSKNKKIEKKDGTVKLHKQKTKERSEVSKKDKNKATAKENKVEERQTNDKTEIINIVKQIIDSEMNSLKDLMKTAKNINQANNKIKAIKDKRIQPQYCFRCSHVESVEPSPTIHTQKSFIVKNNFDVQQIKFESEKELELTKKSHKYNILVNNQELEKDPSPVHQSSFISEGELLGELENKINVSPVANPKPTDFVSKLTDSGLRKSYTEQRQLVENNKEKNYNFKNLTSSESSKKQRTGMLKDKLTLSSDDQMSYMFVNEGLKTPQKGKENKEQLNEIKHSELLSQKGSNLVLHPTPVSKKTQSHLNSPAHNKTNIFFVLEERRRAKEFSMEKEISQLMSFSGKTFKIVIINNLVSMNKLIINAYHDDLLIASECLNLHALKFIFKKASYANYIPYYYRNNGNDKKIEEIIAHVIFQLISIDVFKTKKDSIGVDNNQSIDVMDARTSLKPENKKKIKAPRFSEMRNSVLASALSIHLKSQSQLSNKSFKRNMKDNFFYTINLNPIPTSLLPDLEINLFGDNYLFILTHINGLNFKIYLLSLRKNREIDSFKYIDVFIRFSDFNEFFIRTKKIRRGSVMLKEKASATTILVNPEKKNLLLKKLLAVINSIYYKSQKTFETNQFYCSLKIENLKTAKYNFFKLFINKNDLSKISLITISNEKEDGWVISCAF